jgi:hypothetical protein
MEASGGSDLPNRTERFLVAHKARLRMLAQNLLQLRQEAIVPLHAEVVLCSGKAVLTGASQRSPW